MSDSPGTSFLSPGTSFLKSIPGVIVGTWLAGFAGGLAVGAEPAGTFEREVKPFLEKHCLACHGPEKQKGKVRFDRFEGMTPDNVEMWRLAQESVKLGEMPPEDEPQPKDPERSKFVSWIEKSLELPALGVDAHQALFEPSEGNKVSHERLFDGSEKGPASSPPRMWRRSQSQYDALMEELWVIPKLRNDYATYRTKPEFAHFGYARPFPQMAPENFTNYSGGVHADLGTLKGLMDAGQQVAMRLTSKDSKYHRLHQPAQQIGYHRNAWNGFPEIKPPGLAKAFEPFLENGAQPTNEEQKAAVEHVFGLILDRPPSSEDRNLYGEFLASNIEKADPLSALRGLITAVIVSPEFVFRMEVGMSEPDEHGRRMLSPGELVYALAYAITDAGPDQELATAAESGRLSSREDVEREVRRMLKDPQVEKLPKLRFWQEFFGYLEAPAIFKDPDRRRQFPELLVRDADQLVTHILARDRQVFRQLLTIDRYFVGYPTAGGNEELRASWIKAERDRIRQSLEKSKRKGRDLSDSPQAKLLAEGKTLMPPARHNDAAGWSRQYAMIYGFDSKSMAWTDQQPMKITEARLGMLMHPAWLRAHSTNFDNDIVGRGHWIRERLLAGSMPDIPIDVDAQVPVDETKTLRQRMEVTRQEYCWKCHKRMDPLGLPFEDFDHYGWHRTLEVTDKRGRKKHPVVTDGAIVFSGETQLDGPVKDARELVKRLAGSERVRQSIIRHAFRFWMGRNETLSDSPTLMAADQAYVGSDGSFNEMLVALLTSDSFLYRK